MAGRYGELFGGEGWLGFYSTLDAQILTGAELSADLSIDGQFADWDRHLWSGTVAPPEIRDIWAKVASG